jgi:hypothetical protein
MLMLTSAFMAQDADTYNDVVHEVEVELGIVLPCRMQESILLTSAYRAHRENLKAIDEYLKQEVK